MVCTIEATLEHALFLARHLHSCDLQCAVVAVLLELGIPTNRLGFDYLKNSIVLFCDDPAQMLSKGIYPAVGQLYESAPGKLQIEQSIRAAINEAWKNRDEEVWTLFFMPDQSGVLRKPSNSEFITRIGYFMELWSGCRKEVSNGK